jgi:GMP synthase-like glutamine amidotransferase
MRRIFVVGGQYFYANWMNGVITKDFKEADLVVFTGGEDVSPSLYGEKQGSQTYCNLERDKREVDYFKRAVEEGKHIIGICRGAQLSCVLSGGRLVQDQNNPAYYHPIYTDEGVIEISSTHHQAQYPYDMEKGSYKVLGWTEGMCGHHFDGEDKEISNEEFKEVEIAYYPETRALAIQGHPEEIHGEPRYKKTFEYLDSILDKHLENKL